eukprot:COSAG01_NODE_8016_length_2952_cov_4.907816_4_plen_142_part_00
MKSTHGASMKRLSLSAGGARLLPAACCSDGAEVEPEPVVEYISVARGMVREGFEMSSDPVGALEVGEQFLALERRPAPELGTVRCVHVYMRMHGGWHRARGRGRWSGCSAPRARASLGLSSWANCHRLSLSLSLPLPQGAL